MIIGIEEAIQELKAGKMLIAVDDENRENEGDLICAAETITSEMVNQIVSWGRGLLCVPMDRTWADRLHLFPMAMENTALHHTNFTISVDAIENCTTGISAHDRAETIRRLADKNAKPEDFARPGHIFPLLAKEGGTLRRAGHTEAVVDLLKLAGMNPVGVLCEILDEDGQMARLPSLEKFSKEHGLGIITIEDLIAYRRKIEALVEKVLETKLPTKYGTFQLHLFVNSIDGKEHIALVKGDVTTDEPVLTRVHDQCVTGDMFGSLRCDCGEQLAYALKEIEKAGRGVLLYMAQEGRGIGLINKLKAYVLQDGGLDTVEANLKLGLKADEREYGIGAQILSQLGIKKMRLMTNNPKKIVGLTAFGLEIIEQIPIKVGQNEFNVHYLRTKKEKMGHLL
ncbi:MAG: bifunctional 3,4-dihydroxy-2-butanone-4-phosphate synthase/GTP cyclohydrolase II [bacterium]|jgi:3,4-dihydroxy 2-butanone 4-phosphate synthase/GTP cyclohydrolase II|nr:bifunctional 3,4-dihydroxy-2-butanone-4-phosphate synthase/GTP cyclohydrolase II [bacterium]